MMSCDNFFSTLNRLTFWFRLLPSLPYAPFGPRDTTLPKEKQKEEEVERKEYRGWYIYNNNNNNNSSYAEDKEERGRGKKKTIGNGFSSILQRPTFVFFFVCCGLSTFSALFLPCLESEKKWKCKINERERSEGNAIRGLLLWADFCFCLLMEKHTFFFFR